MPKPTREPAEEIVELLRQILVSKNRADAVRIFFQKRPHLRDLKGAFIALVARIRK